MLCNEKRPRIETSPGEISEGPCRGGAELRTALDVTVAVAADANRELLSVRVRALASEGEG